MTGSAGHSRDLSDDITDDKPKILDVRFPKEEQKKSEALRKKLQEKKYQVDVEIDGKVRFMYGDDPVILENYAKSIGAKILKVTKI